MGDPLLGYQFRPSSSLHPAPGLSAEQTQAHLPADPGRQEGLGPDRGSSSLSSGQLPRITHLPEGRGMVLWPVDTHCFPL